jgi:hypothetical protein
VACYSIHAPARRISRGMRRMRRRDESVEVDVEVRGRQELERSLVFASSAEGGMSRDTLTASLQPSSKNRFTSRSLRSSMLAKSPVRCREAAKLLPFARIAPPFSANASDLRNDGVC